MLFSHNALDVAVIAYDKPKSTGKITLLKWLDMWRVARDHNCYWIGDVRTTLNVT